MIYGYNSTSATVVSAEETLHQSLSRTYTTPFLLDRLPEATGAALAEPIAWHESIDDHYITSQGQSNVLTSTVVTNASSAYTESGMDYDVPYGIVQNANGTGTYRRGPTSATEEWTSARPISSAKGEVIPVTVTFEGQTGVNDVPELVPPARCSRRARLRPPGLWTRGRRPCPQVAAPTPASLRGCCRSRRSSSPPSTATPTTRPTITTSSPASVVPAKRSQYTRTDYDARVTGKVVSVEKFSSTLGLVKEMLK